MPLRSILTPLRSWRHYRAVRQRLAQISAMDGSHGGLYGSRFKLPA